MSDTELTFDRAFDVPAGRLVELSPLVRRILAPNPGPMTFRGTCTYVVGRGQVTVIDPGPDLPEHIDTLLDALGGETVKQILITHTHRDHSPGARLLKARTQAPILGCAPSTPARQPRPDEAAMIAASNDGEYLPDRVLANGDIVGDAQFSLQAVATPGHTMNHLAFALLEDRSLFSGDHVMAWSTSVIAPPDGAMTPYMASLEKLRARDDQVYWPGHGGPVREPQRFLRALLHHRRMRERSILDRLRSGDATTTAIVAATYDALDPRLLRAAALSVLAHLEDLCERGVVKVDGAGLEGRYFLS